MLDNSNFKKTVNQRGQDTYTTTGAAYTIDRWILGIGSIAITENGLICQGTQISSNWIMQRTQCQYGKTYTFSVKLSDGNTYTLTGVATKETPLVASTPFGDIIMQDNIGLLSVFIRFSVNNIMPEWAKLEEGSIATPYIPKNYSEELLECMRFFQWHFRGCHFYLPHVGGSQWYANLQYPIEMRINPTLSCTTAAGTFISSASQITKFGAKLYGGSSAASNYQCILQDIVLSADL